MNIAATLESTVFLRFRSRRRVLRWVAVLALVAGWVAPAALPHDRADDVLCLSDPLSQDAAGLVGTNTEASPEHCQVCHTARSFRTAFNSAERAAIWLTAGQIVESPAESANRRPTIDRLPARAPPILS